MRTIFPSDHELAIHEAGHLIVGMSYQWQVKCVWLRLPDQEELAAVDWQQEDRIPDEFEARAVFAAGLVCESLSNDIRDIEQMDWHRPHLKSDLFGVELTHKINVLSTKFPQIRACSGSMIDDRCNDLLAREADLRAQLVRGHDSWLLDSMRDAYKVLDHKMETAKQLADELERKQILDSTQIRNFVRM